MRGCLLGILLGVLLWLIAVGVIGCAMAGCHR
jgi:hypothetical protein